MFEEGPRRAPAVYRSRARNTRKRLLIGGAVTTLILTGFLIGRCGTTSAPATEPATASSPTCPTDAAALLTSPSCAPAAAPSASAAAPPPSSAAPTPLPEVTVQAEAFAEVQGIEAQETTDEGGGGNVGWINNGDFLRYDAVDFGDTPPVELVARVAVGVDGNPGRIEVRIDARDAPPIAVLNTTGTGGWQNWRTDVTPVTTQVTGVHTVYLTFGNERPDDFANLNWFSFRR